MPGGPEWIVIAAVALLVFGGRKLPELARSLGRAKTEFNKGIREGAEEERRTNAKDPESRDS